MELMFFVESTPKNQQREKIAVVCLLTQITQNIILPPMILVIPMSPSLEIFRGAYVGQSAAPDIE